MPKKTTEVPEVKKSNPFKTISENLPFHNFDENKEFIGLFEKTIILGKEEPFQVNIMKEVKTGNRVFVTDSYTIKESIAKCKEENHDLTNIVFQFIYEGKTTVNGKPFNKFTVRYCTLEEYEQNS